jgi:PIN domain nuclease of toxin-antitoxin system
MLLDTHAFFWWVTDDAKLSANARKAIGESANEAFVSAVVAWELSIKSQFGKWVAARPISQDIESILDENRFQPVAITMAHATLAGLLPSPHRDPFDRLLAAQAKIEELTLVTADRALRHFNIDVLW